MSLNEYVFEIISLVSLIPLLFATLSMVSQYSKYKYPHLKYLAGKWGCMTIWILLTVVRNQLPLNYISNYGYYIHISLVVTDE